MLFYDEFIKKVSSEKITLKENYSFGLNFRKILVRLGTGIPITLIGGFQLWSATKLPNPSVLYYLLSSILIIFGLITIKGIFDYKIKISGTILYNKNISIDLSSVKLVELRKMVAPKSKKLEACLDIITHDKKQIILPLLMGNKLEFTLVVKELTKDKFSIIKD